MGCRSRSSSLPPISARSPLQNCSSGWNRACPCSPAAHAIKRRHAEFFLRVAQTANLNPGKLAPGGQHLAIANAEQDNVRAALTWALTDGSIELALRLAIAMDMFWTANDPREGIRWFAALLEHRGAEAVAPELRAHALRGYGSSFAISGDNDAAERL